MVVDGLWSSVVSTNFDNRSFRLNDEANLNILSRSFAERQITLFNDDLKRSRRITFEE
jgi:cardiolipin synthase